MDKVESTDNQITITEDSIPEGYLDDINAEGTIDNTVENAETQTPTDTAETTEAPAPTDYTLPDKFTNVDDLVKSYKNLESKLGSFEGAPEAYEIDGYEMDAPMMNSLAETAKELNLSNDAFAKIVNKYEEMNDTLSEENFKAEYNKLGENAETRINNLNNQIDTTLNAHQAEVLKGMANTAESIEVIEQLLQQSAPSAPAPIQATATAPSDADIQEMLFAKNENGQLKMENDIEYAKKVNEITRRMWN